MTTQGLGKYKGLLLTLLFFLLFFLMISSFNLYLGNAISLENNRLQLIKTLHSDVAAYQTASDRGESQIPADNLSRAVVGTLEILRNGGEFSTHQLPKLNTTADIRHIDQILLLIGRLDATADDRAIQTQALTAEINKLSVQWRVVIQQKTKRFSILQFAAMGLAVVYFLGIIFQLVRNFEGLDSEIEVVKDQTDNILSTVNEGLFLITPDFEIGTQQSKALRNIFGLKEDIEGNFLEFLEKYVPKKSLEIAKDFLGLLFGKRVKENLIDDLNPLKKVQINLVRRDGSFDAHYINFDFKRVLEDKEIIYVLGSVTDVTKEVLLEIELEETKVQSEAQIDLFMSVLHIPPAQLRLFMMGISDGITQVNAILENTGDKNYREKVDSIYRIIHKIKGDAAILNLHSFEVKAHEFEEVLDKLRENPKLKGEDLLPLAVQLRGMITHQESFQGIFEKFDASKSIVSQANESTENKTEQSAGLSSLAALSKRIADDCGKQVALIEYGTLKNIEDEGLVGKITDCSIQLVRNAVAHGIEDPEQRIRLGKSALGNIHVSLAQTPESIELTVRDDGAGIDIENIKTKASEKGILDIEKLESLNDRQIAGLIFRPDFSTKNNSDMNSGRGVGLDLVRTIANQQNGKILLNWKQDRFTVFKIVFPTNA